MPSKQRARPSPTTATSIGASLVPVDVVDSIAGSLLAATGNDPTTAATTTAAAVGIAALAVSAVVARPPAKLLSAQALQNAVDGTFLSRPGADVRCVYKASRDGFSAMDFHERCDGLGSALVVCRTLTGKTFGGFKPAGYRSSDDYYSSTAAFLFCLKGGNGVVKFPVRPGGDGAVYDYATSGPCFGAADLLVGPPRAAVMGGFTGPDAEDISASAGSLRQGKSFAGGTYDADRPWPVAGTFQLSEVEVYCSV